MVAVIGICVLLYFGISCGAQKGQKAKSALEDFKSAKTWDEKLVCFVFNFVLILKGGFWGFLTLVSLALLSIVSAICGHNPWPYYFEAWDRLMVLFGKSPRVIPAEATTARIELLSN